MVECLTLLKTTKQGTVNAFTVDISVNALDDIGCRFPSLPNKKGYVTLLVAYGSPGKIAGLLVLNPI